MLQIIYTHSFEEEILFVFVESAANISHIVLLSVCLYGVRIFLLAAAVIGDIAIPFLNSIKVR